MDDQDRTGSIVDALQKGCVVLLKWDAGDAKFGVVTLHPADPLFEAAVKLYLDVKHGAG